MWFYVDENKLKEREQAMQVDKVRIAAVVGFGVGLIVAVIIFGGIFTYQVKYGDLTDKICYINDLVR